MFRCQKHMINYIISRTNRTEFTNCRRFVSKGDTFKRETTFAIEDLRLYSNLVQDHNPLHCDLMAARNAGFANTVVHGALINGLVSGIIGSNIPGCVVAKQTLNFPKPLYVNEICHVTVEVVSVRKRIVDCNFKCATSQDKIVLYGDVRLVLMHGTHEASTAN